MILVYWAYKSFKYRGDLNYGIALSKRQILLLVFSEILLFGILFLFYYLNQQPDTANSFAWQNTFFVFSRRFTHYVTDVIRIGHLDFLIPLGNV